MAIAAGAALLATCVLAGCAGSSGIVHEALLDPLGARQPWLPAEHDLAAARLAREALLSGSPTRPRPTVVEVQLEEEDPASRPADPRVEAALEALEALPTDEAQPHLAALGVDLRNATLDDPIADRAASRELEARWGLDPRLDARLERLIRDDPLELAGRRRFDTWHRLWARTFNAIVEPIGSSAITGFVLAPYQLANSLIHYFAAFSNSEPLSTTDRQALALRKEYVLMHPDAPDTPEVQEQVDDDEPELARTWALRSTRAAENAIDARAWRLAIHHAEHALTLLEAHPEENEGLRNASEELLEEAIEGRAIRSARRRRSLEARPTPEATVEAEYAVAREILLATRVPLGVEFSATDLESEDDERHESYVRPRTEYLRAIAQQEAGFEAGARRRLTRAASDGVEANDMARHARIAIDDEWQNPHGAFERLKAKAVREELGWRLAGEWVNRPRYPNLWAPVAYLIDAPTIAITIVMAPLRAIVSPWVGDTPDFRRAAALAGYRYLIRHPEGEEQRAVIQWLYDYESDRDRPARALRMADWIPEFDPEERAELVEQTAEQRLAQVERLDRRDERASVLRGVAQDFPDSTGGHVAGLRAREEREDASPQHIRITRGFFIENPEVAGRDGLGLNASLLDEDLGNGELHPEGVVLRGGRMLEIRLVAEGEDEDAPPTSRYVELSPQRLQQLAATLDDAVQRNGLIDPEARQGPDPRRDVYLERAALGLADDLDMRSTAESSFVYRSLRERYGIVRGRDSLLPVDLVFRGSLGDFTLGAFPRWRAPRETPDAFLYR